MITNFDSIVFKPEWMRPPSWRWMASEEFLADPYKEVDTVKSDPALRELSEFKRCVKKNLNNPHAFWKKYPEMSTAYQIFLSDMAEGWRWLIEAYLMTDLTDRKIANRLDVPIDAGTIKRYRTSFFDISLYNNSEAAIMANLLAVSKARAFDTGIPDFTWKVFAYVWGPDKFEQTFFPKGKRPQECREWLKTESERMIDVHTFHTTRDLRNMYNDNVINLLDTARQHWQIPDQGGHLAKEDKESFLNTLSRHVHMKILDAPPKKDYGETYNEEDKKVFEKAK